MAVPRPVLLLAVLGAALMAATFYAVRGANQAGTGTPAPSLPKTSSAPTDVTPKAKAKAHPAPAPHQRHTNKAPATTAPTTKAPATKAKPKRPAPREPAGAKQGLPVDVARALARKRVVVLFFFARGAADDSATARSVAAVRGQRKKVSVFTAPVSRLAHYQRVIGSLGVSTVPSTVVVGPDRRAHVLEGFVDGRSLIQEVADAARSRNPGTGR
jgi:hypothetical protein